MHTLPLVDYSVRRTPETKVMCLVLVFTAALVVAGCAKEPVRRYDAHYPSSQAEAGTVTVAVVSVERWQDVVNDLKPNFTLTGDTALQKVLPVTAALQTKILDSLGVNVSAALPTMELTRARTVTRTEADDTETREVAEEKTDARTSGTPPELSDLPTPPRTAKDLPGIDNVAELFKDTIGNPPTLEYQTALALFQEVRLLNRYVDAAVGRHGFTPYLVRLQVGITPYAHRQPYDVYTRIGFFNGLALEEVCNDPDIQERCIELASRTPEVVPLVVTDDIELTRQARATEVVRQLQAALSGTLQGVGLAAQLQSLTINFRLRPETISTVCRL